MPNQIEDQAPVVGILMPKISNSEMFSFRYGGLEKELNHLGATAAFSFTHDSYDPHSHSLGDLVDTKSRFLAEEVRPLVVRDLTMPKSDDRPIYTDPNAPKIVHHPIFSAFLRDKRNAFNLFPELHPQTISASRAEIKEAAAAICGDLVVVKPVTGERSQGIFIGKKQELPNNFEAAHYLVQEFIDTSGGVEELGIRSVHNVRLLSIDSQVIGAIGRINDAAGNHLHGEQNDVYGSVYLPEDLPQTMLDIAIRVQEKFKDLPGDGHNIIAIDLMRGFNAQGDEVDVLCEINRRPLRISEYDLIKPQRDPRGIQWLASQWDTKEAQLLSEAMEKE